MNTKNKIKKIRQLGEFLDTSKSFAFTVHENPRVFRCFKKPSSPHLKCGAFSLFKVKTREELIKIVEELKKHGKKIVTCNGCFDILHAGHIKFLEEAKSQGDILIVGLNSNLSVKQNKGSKRPVNNQNNRATVLAALQCVDYITIFDEKTPIELLEVIKPDIHVNGEEYGKNCIEAPTVKKYGGKIYIVKLVKGLSTTNIIKSLKNEKIN